MNKVLYAILFCLISSMNAMDFSPLNIALSIQIENENLPAIEALLNQGANPNQRLPELTSTGKVKIDELPLTRATSKGNIAMIALLLQAGADPSLRNASGETALEMAQRSTRNLEAIRLMFNPHNNVLSEAELKNQEIIQLLESYLPTKNKLS